MVLHRGGPSQTEACCSRRKDTGYVATWQDEQTTERPSLFEGFRCLGSGIQGSRKRCHHLDGSVLS